MKTKSSSRLGIFYHFGGKILTIFALGMGPNFGSKNGLEKSLILLFQGKHSKFGTRMGLNKYIVEYMQVPNWAGPGVKVTRNNIKI